MNYIWRFTQGNIVSWQFPRYSKEGRFFVGIFFARLSFRFNFPPSLCLYPLFSLVRVVPVRPVDPGVMVLSFGT